MFQILIGILIFNYNSFASQVRYDGFKVYQVFAKDSKAYESLVNLERNSGLDFWTESKIQGPTDIMIPPEESSNFLKFLQEHQIEYKIKINDVQKLMDKNRLEPLSFIGPRSNRYTLTWDGYYNLSVIHDFCRELASSYPEFVQVTSPGQSYQGRELLLVKISSGLNPKNSVFIDGGIHAREWITPATVTYIMRELVENYSAHPEFVDNIDWYFMPVINPDGYEYTHSTDRLWRKTRSPRNGTDCIGTDMNRNFDFHWNEGGSSPDPCSETYHGGSPFSEVESRIVRDSILANANQIKVYISFHSYSQVWMLPWGWTSELSDDYNQLFELGQNAVNALTALYGTEYEIKPAASSSVVTGISSDWARGVANISRSFAIELRDNGEWGFELPPSQILANAEEIWEALKVVANEVMQIA